MCTYYQSVAIHGVICPQFAEKVYFILLFAHLVLVHVIKRISNEFSFHTMYYETSCVFYIYNSFHNTSYGMKIHLRSYIFHKAIVILTRKPSNYRMFWQEPLINRPPTCIFRHHIPWCPSGSFLEHFLHFLEPLIHSVLNGFPACNDDHNNTVFSFEIAKSHFCLILIRKLICTVLNQIQ